MDFSATKVRQRILKMAYVCNRSTHLGGSLSMVEILTVLYRDVLKLHYDNMTWQDRDRFILSKGHCVMALYAVLAECGVIGEEEIKTFMQDGSVYGSHPVLDIAHGIESSNGSLGQGVSLAIGIAKTAKIKKKGYKVYVLVGNGECNEGAVWEAFMLATQWKLDNLTIIIDNNNMQSDGTSGNIIDLRNIGDALQALGMDVIEIDGHNETELRDAFSQLNINTPKVIIANTVKGKGISFMEGNNEWHHNRLIEETFNTAMQEL